MLRLPQYTLIEPVQRDGQTSVYRGHRADDRRPILARVIEDEHPSPATLARLRHEHAIATELALDGVLAPLACEPHGHGLVQIWSDPGGVTLRRLLDHGPIPLARALRIAASLARTLAAVHARGVIHKHLAPQHVLVSGDADTHLFGFDIASRLSRETPQLASASTLEGALAYVSPEQTGRMNRVVDRRSDLYSLGVVLYELLTGSVPFPTTDTLELLYCHLVRPPPPPDRRAAGLPEVVSRLVLKLLAKNAEDRYQLARSVADDLDACLDRLEADGSIAEFPLATGDHDHDGRLDIPQRLYGREAECRALLEAWTRVVAGTTELLLVRGYSGIGKSVLVRELHRELTGARGQFVAGKFDQLGRVIPYAPITAALRELVHLLVTSPEAELVRLRSELLAAVGDDLGALLELVPELERLIPGTSPVAELGGAAGRNRLARVVAEFLRVCTSSGRPLVVFLDDLQWADPASLELIAALLGRVRESPLLVIGAYRSNEVDAGHPLTATLRELSGVAKIRTLELGPLARGDVQRFIADALATERGDVESLARLVYAKTEGNPFFLIQLLVALHEDGVLRWDARARRHHWDEQAVREVAAADNVVGFMVTRLQRLPAPTLRALELAACVGHRFELASLAVVAERAASELATDLWPALEQGMIVALDPAYRLLRDDRAPASGALRFLHDRVQQAAYAGVDEAERAALHLKIGRLMRASPSWRGDSFELVTHLNFGRALIDDADERRELARLNLDVGRRARAAAAYASATALFTTGLALLGEQGHEHEPQLAFALELAAAEASMLAGDHDAGERHTQALLGRPLAPLERAEVLDLCVVSRAARARSADAVEAGVEGLNLLGFSVPEVDARQQAYARELDEVLARLGERDLDALAETKPLDDPRISLALRLARHTALSAFGTSTNLGYWLTALAARLSLAHGHSDQSSAAYALLGAVLASSTTRFAEAHTLVKLALTVHERRGEGLHQACMLGFYFTTVSHYTLHWRTLLDDLERARVAGLESGDLLFHSYTCSHRSVARLMLGDPLDELRQEVEGSLAQMRAHKLESAAATQVIVRQTIACLEGRTQGPTELGDDLWREQPFVESMIASRMSFALYWYRTTKGMLLLLAGDHQAALAQLEPVMDMIPIAFTPEARWLTALALLGLPTQGEQHERHEQLLARCRRDLELWARACPANYRHRQLLVEAEYAGRTGELARAMDSYDQAIAAAQAHDWPRDLAIINELAAKFYLARGHARIARAYMTDACYGYASWGAVARVRQLAEQFPDLVPIEAQLESQRHRTGVVADEVDMIAFARSLQTIALEVVLDSVVERTMRLVTQNAGAERGVLFLDRDGRLELYAKVTTDPPRVSVGPGRWLDDERDLPASIIRYVARLSESVVLDDAATDGRFAADPFIKLVRPRSIACMPMTHQGRVRGVIYLENNATKAAFTSRRLELLGLLTSQAMISIDNAELYARVQAVKDELARANSRLEADVAASTAQLQASNERLRVELGERQRAEAERARVQAELVTELSTPVIRFGREILIMPVIGTLDEDRAREIRERALQWSHEQRARVLILDLTGIRRVDRTIASALLSTTRALRMIGTQVIVNGIGPEMAITLVAIGSELDQLRISTTLADAVALAGRKG